MPTLVCCLQTLFIAAVTSLPKHQKSHDVRQASSPPLVFAHYMVITQPPDGDYTKDINMAKSAGIDAFAVNYQGPDFQQSDSSLTRLYQQAKDLDFKLFISIDTTSVTDPSMAVNLTKTFANWDSQLKIDDKVMLSSFSVNYPAWNWQTDVLDPVGQMVLFVPGSLNEGSQGIPADEAAFGQFTWVHPAAPENDQQNTNGQLSEQAIDQDFASWQTPDKPWMAGVAPYFFKRFEPNSWLNAQDSDMWFDRWLKLLKVKPRFIEVVTWNDFGESSYIGPADSTPPAELANQPVYYGNLTHSGFYDMAKMFISNFKAGQSEITVKAEEEDVFMMYRTQPVLVKGIDDHEDWETLPRNVSSVSDSVYVFSFLTSDAIIYLNSGGTTYSINAKAGVNKAAIPWKLGDQSITANRAMSYGQLQKTGPPISPALDRYSGNVVCV